MAKKSVAPIVRVNWLDRVLIGLAPRWAMNRIRARAGAATLARFYDAAGTGRRTDGWPRPAGDGNATFSRSLNKLRDLSRDLRRNNGWARRGVQTIVNNTIGWGIQPRVVADSNAALATAAGDAWKGWADSTACDFAGRMNFYGLQKLVMRTVVESGEALVINEAANAADGLSVPIRIHVVEPDHLDQTKDGPIDGGHIHQGVEVDARGRRVAYWLFRVHPGSTQLGAVTGLSVRVPADRVLHVYDVERADMMRGVPWLSAAITRLNDFDDFEDAQLMQQKIAACFGAFVTDVNAESSALGEQDPDDEKLENFEPGHIEYLGSGKDVKFATPPVPTTMEFSVGILRRIGVSIGVTYEDLTGDYSKVNFSSARMARLAHWANVEGWRWDMFVPQFCDGVWRWVMGMAAGMNGWPVVPGAEWSPPPMPMLEPDREGLAYSRLVRNGVMTLSEVIRERGGDVDQHLAEYAATNKKLDDLGIVLDSDARKTSAAGQAQIEASADPDAIIPTG